MTGTRAGIMFFDTLTQFERHTNIVTAIGTFQDIARPALGLVHGSTLITLTTREEPFDSSARMADSLRAFRLRRNGGEGGIRTHGRVSPTHAFQACSLNRSDTSPRRVQPIKNNRCAHGEQTAGRQRSMRLIDLIDRLRGGAIGSTSDFGSENPGSSPGPGARKKGSGVRGQGKRDSVI